MEDGPHKCCVAPFEDGEEATNKGMLATSRSWKRPGKILPWGLQRDIGLLTPDFSTEGPVLNF